MVSADQSLRVGQDIILILDDGIGRQGAVLLAERKAASRQVKTDAHLACGLDLGIHVHVVYFR
jgi:hypothetical protein